MVPYENIMGNEIQDIKFFIPADYNNIKPIFIHKQRLPQKNALYKQEQNEFWHNQLEKLEAAKAA